MQSIVDHFGELAHRVRWRPMSACDAISSRRHSPQRAPHGRSGFARELVAAVNGARDRATGELRVRLARCAGV